MTDRILDVSESPARLSVQFDQLVVASGGEDHRIPIEDLAVVVISDPRTLYTHAALARLATSGTPLVVCNDKRMPCGMLLSVDGHFTQAERFAAQAQAKLPVKKRLWQEVVRAKINAQAKLLQDVSGSDAGLMGLVQKVSSGDKENVEAQAARRYWPALFGNNFQRDRNADDINRHLNYGYAVLRAIVARAICAAGLHPSLGIHHHNRYDAFCLADDLMEPYRPLVDKAAYDDHKGRGSSLPLDATAKTMIIAALTSNRFDVKGEMRTLFDVLSRKSQTLASIFAGQAKKLDFE